MNANSDWSEDLKRTTSGRTKEVGDNSRRTGVGL